jgi:hypothetical protein
MRAQYVWYGCGGGGYAGGCGVVAWITNVFMILSARVCFRESQIGQSQPSPHASESTM